MGRRGNKNVPRGIVKFLHAGSCPPSSGFEDGSRSRICGPPSPSPSCCSIPKSPHYPRRDGLCQPLNRCWSVAQLTSTKDTTSVPYLDQLRPWRMVKLPNSADNLSTGAGRSDFTRCMCFHPFLAVSSFRIDPVLRWPIRPV